MQLSNWKSFENLKISGVQCPGSFYGEVELDFPLSMGDYRFPQKTDEPCLVHLQCVPVGPGKTAREQQRTGRAIMLSTNFAAFERNLRNQMTRILASGGFDATRDIQAITVNRWPHGYSYEYNSLFDPVWPELQMKLGVSRLEIFILRILMRVFLPTPTKRSIRAIGRFRRLSLRRVNRP